MKRFIFVSTYTGEMQYGVGVSWNTNKICVIILFWLMVALLTEMFEVLSFFINNRFNECEKRKSDAFHTIYQKKRTESRLDVFQSVDTQKSLGVKKKSYCFVPREREKIFRFSCTNEKKNELMQWTFQVFEPILAII